MKRIKQLLALLLVMVMVMVNVPAPVFAVGTTNEDGYIEVRTIEDLYNIRNDMTANYILMNDIDLTVATAEGGDWDYSGRGWNPIGSDDIYTNNAFSGVFDGNGYSIIGMRMEGELSLRVNGSYTYAYLGLFAHNKGVIRNLSIRNVNINLDGGYIYIGAIAAENSGEIYNCCVSGNFVAYGYYVGGISGKSQGVISNCCSTARMYGAQHLGGIAGLSTGSIENCYNSGDICGTGYLAIGNEASIGGIVAANKASSVGVASCYNAGTLLVDNTSIYHKNVKKMCGITHDGRVNNSYYLKTNIGISGLGVSLSESQMKIQASFAGFNFDDIWVLDESAVYPYPQLRNNQHDTRLVEKIVITTQPNKIVYEYEEPLILDGCTLTVKTTDGDVLVDVTKDMVSGYNAKNPGVQTITVSYRAHTTTFDVMVNDKVTGVEMFAIPARTEYLLGEAIDPAGGILRVSYVSGNAEFRAITKDMLAGYDPNIAGNQTIQVIYAGQTATYDVQVINLSSVELLTMPRQAEFVVGTAFDYTGATIRANYENGAEEVLDVTANMVTGLDITKEGIQTATVTYKGCTTTFDITVSPIKMVRLVLEQLPDKVTYVEGQPLDTTGMKVVVLNNDDTKIPVVSGYTVSGYTATPGTCFVTVSFAGMSADFTVEVVTKTLKGIRIDTLPDKQKYVEGQSLNLNGLTVFAVFNNGDQERIENYVVSGFDSEVGIHTVVVEYNGFTAEFTVDVIEKTVESLEIAQFPEKLSYWENEQLDTKGLAVKAIYNDASIAEIVDYELIGFSSNPGTHILSIVYGGQVASFEITVKAKEMVRLAVKLPTKLSYYPQEEFDPTGMVVTAHYNNGQKFEVNDYVMTGFDSETVGTKTITVTYNGFSSCFAVSVCERSEILTGGSFTVDNKEARLGEQVVVPVTVSHNTGLAGLVHTLSFDERALKLVSVEFQGDFEKGTMVLNEEKLEEGLLTVLWFSDSDIAVDGKVYYLIFEVLETAEDGIADVTITFQNNGNGNISGENVIFGANDGSVEVKSYWLGDLNGDRKYAMVDLVMLAQYVADFDMTLSDKQQLSADVNEDGIIDIHDVILLNQWLLTEKF